ncbi:MAG: DNA polymerase III subunit gamma/tau [Patescibacteria group bacterium]
MSLYRKYRPQQFSDVTGQDHVRETIQNQIAGGGISHAYLFTGPRGIGKTTMARLLAKAVNCLDVKKNEPCNKCEACCGIQTGASLDVVEIDAASNTDVENVRENIIKSVRFAPNSLAKRVYIIDEVHMLSTSSFNALLKTLEEPPAHALFILATTEIHKVPQTIISRCQRFDFRKIPKDDMLKRLKGICKKEKVEIDDDVLMEVVKHSDGSARDSESLLDQIIALGEDKITMDTALIVLPNTNTVLINDFTRTLFVKDVSKLIALLNEYVESGVDVQHFLDDVIEFLRESLIEKLKGTEHAWSVDEFRNAIDLFLTARRNIKTDKISHIGMEMAIIQICQQNFNGQGVGSSRSGDSPVTPPNPPLKRGGSDLCPHFQGGQTSEAGQGVVDASDSIEPKATAFENTLPVIDIEDVKKRWPEVFAQIKECSASLPFVVQAGEIECINNDELELRFQYQLHADTVNREKNRNMIETVFARVVGRPIRIKGVYSAPEQDEVVASLLDEFGGKLQ